MSLLVAVVLVGAACGTSTPGAITVPAENVGVVQEISYTAPCGSYESIVDLAPLGMNALANRMDAAVLATVVDISEPWWNTESGHPASQEDLRVPADRPWYRPVVVRYRTVTLAIDRIVSSRVSGISVGSTVDLVVLGSGIERGCRLWGDVDVEMAAGRLKVGDQHLVLVATGEVPFEAEALVASEFASGDYRSQWRVAGEMAINLDGQRSVNLRDLERRILDEVRRGLLDPAGDIVDYSQANPLAPDIRVSEQSGPETPVEAPCAGEDC